MFQRAKITVCAMATCLAGHAASACDYCERQVTLTPDLADCYLAKVDAEIAQMQQSGLPAQLINLATCDGAETAKRGAASLPGVTEQDQKPSLSFILDAPALRCLAQRLQSENWTPERVKTFEVRRDCETQ